MWGDLSSYVEEGLERVEASKDLEEEAASPFVNYMAKTKENRCCQIERYQSSDIIKSCYKVNKIFIALYPH